MSNWKNAKYSSQREREELLEKFKQEDKEDIFENIDLDSEI